MIDNNAAAADPLIAPALHLDYITITIEDIAQGGEHCRDLAEQAALYRYDLWAQQYGAGTPAMMQQVHRFESELAVLQTALDRYAKLTQ